MLAVAEGIGGRRAAHRDRLAERRRAVGLTQEELAGRLGVERSTVVRWEAGVTRPLPWLCPRLARALQVRAGQLAELLAGPAPASPSPGPAGPVDPGGVGPGGLGLDGAGPGGVGLDGAGPGGMGPGGAGPGGVGPGGVGPGGVGPGGVGPGGAGPGGAGPGGAGPGRAGPVAPVPRQLPAAVAGFTGRAAELAALSGLLEDAGAGAPGTVVVCAIGGTAGVGKTALALHWAHQVAARFGGGQLHVNLRGFDPSAAPMAPAQAIRGFLDALGVPPARIPAHPDAQAGLYRSLTAGRALLIVLDNARDEAQVRPLLPASPASLVLVTSRHQLTGLAADGTRLLTLDILPHRDAVHLLTTRLGPARADAEPAAVTEIAAACAGLPLALAVAAARAAARPAVPLADLAAELRDTTGPLDALDTGDLAGNVRAVFSWSYQQLTPAAARMFRLLGLHPGPDITVPAAASLTATALPRARRALGELARAHLIGEHAPGRYACHDLLRAYATTLAHDADTETERSEATGRVLDHYLHTAGAGCLLLEPAHEPVTLPPPRPGTTPERPADHQQALAWFEAEHQVLLATITLADSTGFDTHAWQLPWAMAPFLTTRGHHREWVATQRAALAAATRLGDIAGQGVSSRLLAIVCTNLGDHDQARAHLAHALGCYRRLGSRLGEGKVHQELGRAAEHQGRYADALAHAEQALRMYQSSGHGAAEADALNNIGWCHALLGNHQQTRAFCQQALALSEPAAARRIQAYAWDSLGYAEHHRGDLGEAAACYQRALRLSQQSGDRWLEAATLTHLGDARYSAGELVQARRAWQQALAMFEDMQDPKADQVRAKLAGVGEPGRCAQDS